MSTHNPAERGADRATAMDAAEIDAFLDRRRTLVLVTLRRDGSPVAHPLWFARVGTALYVNARRDSLKVRNVSRDSRFCAVAEAGESYFELCGVRVEGRCEAVEDPGEIARAEAAQREKDARIGSGMAELPAWFAPSRERRLARGDRVMLRLSIERIYSWDFSKLRGHYVRAGGLAEE